MNEEDGDQHFAFHFNPQDVTLRFDAILSEHLAAIPSFAGDDKTDILSSPLTLSKVKTTLTQIHTQIQLLKARSADLRHAMSTMSDQERLDAFAELTHLAQRVESSISEANDAQYVSSVRRLMRKRRKKRAALKERRDLRQRRRSSTE